MDEKAVIGILDELAKETGAVGLSEVEKFAKHQNRDKLQELLDYFRICIKYQVFDLEVTRRENEILRKLLRENNSPNF